MVTLTYRPGCDWGVRDVTGLLKAIREYLRRRDIPMRYVWVAEMQLRGAVHYHLLLWLPRGISLPKPDKRGWWRHGMTRIEWARRPIGYVAKYYSKGGEGIEFPRGLRLHGCGGLSSSGRREKRWWCAPSYVRRRFCAADDVHRNVGGGWIARATGEVVASEWVCVAFGAGYVVLQRTTG